MAHAIPSPLRAFVVLALFLSVFSSAASDDAAIHTQKHDAPVKRALLGDDQVRIFFCSSCGFQQNFMEVKKHLEDTFPQLIGRIDGENYPVGPMKAMLAKAIGFAQLVAMVLMVVGEQIFRALGLDDTLLKKALDNRIGCFAVILLMGSVSQGMVSSGAFEVYFNEELIFSKLQLDRWPTLDELSQLLEAKGLHAI